MLLIVEALIGWDDHAYFKEFSDWLVWPRLRFRLADFTAPTLKEFYAGLV